MKNEKVKIKAKSNKKKLRTPIAKTDNSANSKSVGDHPEPLSAGLDLRKFLEVLGETDITEFEYEKGDMHLIVKKGDVGEMLGESSTAAPLSKTFESSADEVSAANFITKVIKSPAVGTFQLLDGEKLLCSVGLKVKKGEKIAWVNSMGIPQDIITEKVSTITKIFCKDREVVEWGQPLFEVREKDV